MSVEYACDYFVSVSRYANNEPGRYNVYRHRDILVVVPCVRSCVCYGMTVVSNDVRVMLPRL